MVACSVHEIRRPPGPLRMLRPPVSGITEICVPMRSFKAATWEMTGRRFLNIDARWRKQKLNYACCCHEAHNSGRLPSFEKIVNRFNDRQLKITILVRSVNSRDAL